MLLQYFGFQQEPFGASPDPRCLYLSHTHREALASLDYGYLSNRGFTAMIAPPGMGKTTLLFRFLETIRESARSVFLFDIDSQLRAAGFCRLYSARHRHRSRPEQLRDAPAIDRGSGRGESGGPKIRGRD